MASLPEHLMSRRVGRRPLPRQVMIEHQRERVLGAAIEVFAKRGYKGTTIDHIVAAAHIGVGKFYELFDGKEDCFLQTFEQIATDASEQIAAAIEAESSWPERVCAGIAELLRAIAAEPLRARIALVEAQTAGPAALARYEAKLEWAAQVFRRSREVSSVGSDLPETLEEATAGGLAWLLHQRVVMGEGKDVERLFPEVVTIVLEPYVGSAEVRRLIAAGPPTRRGAL